MHPIEVLQFYSKCKSPTKEEREMKSLGMGKTEYEAFNSFRKGDKNSWMWFLISNKKLHVAGRVR